MKWNHKAARAAIQAAGGADLVAEQTGLARATVQRLWQRGRAPNFETAAIVAEATGHSLEDFRRK